MTTKKVISKKDSTPVMSLNDLISKDTIEHLTYDNIKSCITTDPNNDFNVAWELLDNMFNAISTEMETLHVKRVNLINLLKTLHHDYKEQADDTPNEITEITTPNKKTTPVKIETDPEDADLVDNNGNDIENEVLEVDEIVNDDTVAEEEPEQKSVPKKKPPVKKVVAKKPAAPKKAAVPTPKKVATTAKKAATPKAAAPKKTPVKKS